LVDLKRVICSFPEKWIVKTIFKMNEVANFVDSSNNVDSLKNKINKF
jgi:hypothetical protein